MTKLRVAVATARYPPLTGGIELHAEEVARRLVQRGAEVTVLTTDISRRLPSVERRDGVGIRRFRAWPSGRDYYFSPGMFGAIGRGNWDVVHVQGFQTLVAPTAMLAALRFGLPYVVTFHAGGHSSMLRTALEPARERVLRPLLARADRLVALTSGEMVERAGVLRLPQERFVVIPNGSDLPDDGSHPVERDRSLIASVGRLERYKGHHRVIAALPQIARRRSDVRLWIAGSGPYEAELRRLADELDVSDRIEIREVPIRERSRMAAELSRVSVIVCLSEYESHGIAVLEGVGRGCRAVVARAPGLAALVGEGLARGVSAEAEPYEVAEAVIEELDKPPLSEPPKLWTWEQCAEAVGALYETVVRAHRRD